MDMQAEWQAKCDADTLKRAKEIEMDKSRLNNATNAIQKELEAANNVLKENKVSPNTKGKVTMNESGIPQFD